MTDLHQLLTELSTLPPAPDGELPPADALFEAQLREWELLDYDLQMAAKLAGLLDLSADAQAHSLLEAVRNRIHSATARFNRLAGV